MSRLLLFLLVMFTTAACLSQKQGISGRVVWVEGNQMPGPDKKIEPAKGIAREIYIYEPTNTDQVRRVNSLFEDIRTRLVKTVTSNENGEFTIELPEGEYSIFIKEEKGYFGNLFDEKGRINIVRVDKKNVTPITIEVNYEAAY